ncbi:hypothetical protein NUW54_g6250 [Trametes sanguinea]|uniref:Uncharacterized protein n=1 Tax=Trametes sanguinea TaxID=158606 RepID=A0ACC1PSV2_9APHY|nr:hypothetical protein NUW54_g6250 [Trametes sanguinea]
MVARVKNECRGTSFANRQLVNVPESQRMEYNNSFETLHRMITELDQKLHHYACVMKEDAIRKLVLMILAVQQQREMLSGSVPKTFLPLESIKVMAKQVQAAADAFKAFVSMSMPNGHAQPGAPAPGQQQQQSMIPHGQPRPGLPMPQQPQVVPASAPPPSRPAAITCISRLMVVFSHRAMNPVVRGDIVVSDFLNSVGGYRHKARRDLLLDILDVDLDWHMHQISDGERRRVQLVMGLMADWDVLLLDEVRTCAPRGMWTSKIGWLLTAEVYASDR